MRLFVGVPLDAAVAQRIAACGEELQREVFQRAPHARINWVSVDLLHVTLRFIGEVDEQRASAIAATLEPTLTTQAFDIVVGGVGRFPERGVPRVLWAGISAGADMLGALAREATERLRSCRVPPEERLYRAHITLARVRDAAGLRPHQMIDEFGDRDFGTSRVDAITLFQSRTSPKGAVYTALQRTPLDRGSG